MAINFENHYTCLFVHLRYVVFYKDIRDHTCYHNFMMICFIFLFFYFAACRRVNCEKKCSHGNTVDREGCKTCFCAPHPSKPTCLVRMQNTLYYTALKIKLLGFALGNLEMTISPIIFSVFIQSVFRGTSLLSLKITHLPHSCISKPKSP